MKRLSVWLIRLFATLLLAGGVVPIPASAQDKPTPPALVALFQQWRAFAELASGGLDKCHQWGAGGIGAELHAASSGLRRGKLAHAAGAQSERLLRAGFE